MKQLSLLGIVLLISACAAQAPPPPNTTFDGNYDHVVINGKTTGCPDLSLPTYLTISHGSALWQGANLTFQGNVTPQGSLYMTSGSGQTIQGQIDSKGVIMARVTGQNCAYDLTWSRLS
jgi:hypothetical protein